MYIACSGLVCDIKKYPTIGGSLRKIKELGFSAFDLDALEGWQHVDPSAIARGNEAWIRGLLGAVTRLGLRVSSVNCSLSRKLTDPDRARARQHGHRGAGDRAQPHGGLLARHRLHL